MGGIMGQEYGPNSRQVANFIAALTHLRNEAWEEALARFRKSRRSALSAVIGYVSWHLAWKDVRRAGRDEAKELALNAARARGLDRSHDQQGPDRMTMIGAALLALVVRDAISRSHFVRLYEPFERVIPVAALDGPKRDLAP
jgi:hypothetical protein